MPIVPKPDDKSFDPVPQGNHVAVCYRVIDLGTQEGEYQGKKNHKRKILVSWEIPDEKMTDGRPFTIGQRFTWSMSEKASLRKTLESWRGKAFVEDDFGKNGFDIKSILGAGCMVNVVHDKNGDKTYSNIASVARLPKGMKAPAPKNLIQYVWLSHDEFDKAAFEGLSDNLKIIIQQSPEYAALAHPERTLEPVPGSYGETEMDELEGEIPF